MVNLNLIDVLLRGKIRVGDIMIKKIILPLVVFVFLGGALGESRTGISRSIADMTLGMEINHFIKRFSNKEVTSKFSLLRGDRVFSIQKMTDDIDSVLNTFYNGRLYRIDVFYSLPFSQRVPWKSFLKEGNQAYGKGEIIDSMEGPIVIWGDELSSLKMERRVFKGDQNRYVLSLLDNALYLSRGETCSSQPLEI